MVKSEMPLARSVAPLSAYLCRPSPYPNWAHDRSLEQSSSIVSGTPKLFKFGGHLPPQNLYLIRLLLCVKKEAERSFLGSFWTFWWPRFSPKFKGERPLHLSPKLSSDVRFIIMLIKVETLVPFLTHIRDSSGLWNDSWWYFEGYPGKCHLIIM